MSEPAEVLPVVRERLSVHGRVQGVGFRPFVYRLARELGLVGLVGNDSHGAFIEIQGPAAGIAAFKARLVAELPPLARISDLAAQSLPVAREDGFRIETSAADGTQDAEITPDMALCADCRRELFDPADRRHRYPFTNCTNCGPRYSIIRAVPYDRPNTTMASFTMCPACQAEYDDPGDRRFHAQPNACAVCGPRVWLAETELTRRRGDAGTRREEEETLRGGPASQCSAVASDAARLRSATSGQATRREEERREEVDNSGGGDAIEACARLLGAGRIVAIKGLGGFHLACRADDDEAVAALRARKSRESKPLALMVADLEMARSLAHVDASAAAALTDARRPIVLVPRRTGAAVSSHVAPGTDLLGLMLPYTPLHELLFAEGLGPLVMTSGNPTEEPLCCDNDEALTRLAEIADAFLLHDRDIERRVDDSVVLSLESDESAAGGVRRTVDGEDAAIVPIRRARGFAPAPMRVPVQAARPVLAVGAELKSTVCVLDGRTAIVSEHLGELANAKAYRNFVATVEQFKQLLRVEPNVIAYDLHPEYSSTRYALAYARERGLPAVGVQHHHAHIVSAMAEHGLTGQVLGIACDGTGFGTDGTIWGCELLVADAAGFERAGHLRRFQLLGGDVAARQTWRPAAGLLFDCFGDGWPEAARSVLSRVSPESIGLARSRLAAGRLPWTSSLGRLFDAVAFLLGVCDENGHEAEAAMGLESAAGLANRAETLTFDLQPREDGGRRLLELDVRPMVRQMLERVASGETAAPLARAFHETMAEGLGRAAVRIAAERSLDRVVLSGGCFANRLLLASLARRLESMGLAVFAHRQVPTGDGGVSLGQAVCAAGQSLEK